MSNFSNILLVVALIIVAVVIFLFSRFNSTKFLNKPKRFLEEVVIAKKGLDGSYELLFNTPGNYTVYGGDKIDNIDYSTPIKKLENQDSMHFIPPQLEERYYFAVVAESGDTVVVSERRIPMEGLINFRDLGGIVTKDNRYTVWGKIFRSDRLSDMTTRDLQYFEHLGIKTINDFRNDIEIEKHPDIYPSSYEISYHRYPIADKTGEEYLKIKDRVIKGKMKGPEAKELFIYIMSQFADTAATDLKPVFDHLLAEDIPLLYHCTGGKDRTGYMTAMILSALNVDRKTIMQEYLMSNYYRYDKSKKNIRRSGLIGLDAEVATYAFTVQKAYLEAVWDVIDNKYDGLDNYLLEKFDLTPEKRQRLIELYTNPVMSMSGEESEEVVETNQPKGKATEAKEE